MTPRGDIPSPTLERLAEYLRCLTETDVDVEEFISSDQLGKRTRWPAELVRRDLSYFGEFGRRGVGYNVTLLRHALARILELNRPQPVVLVGLGNLGRALLTYPGWDRFNLFIAAVFDTDPRLVGKRVLGHDVLNADAIPEVVPTTKARMAMLSVPGSAAQEVADQLVACGIRGLLNFAPLALEVPKTVLVRNVSFITELAVLSHYTAQEQ
ncbi:MAG TPA: redox-sensing transcriptional repressor Rex [Armatimonadota bacterium]